MTTGLTRGEVNFASHGAIPIIFSELLLAILDVKCAALKCVNTTWEKEISNFGDIVRVRQLGNINVANYAPYTPTLNYQTIVDNYQDLVIDQQSYWAFLIDYMDIQQSDIDLLGGYADRAAIATRNKLDTFVQSVMASNASAASTIGAPSIGQVLQLTPKNIFNRLSTAPNRLLGRNSAYSITDERPFMLIPYDVKAVMEDAERVKVRASHISDTVDEGEEIETWGHFDLEETNNMPQVAAVPGISDDYFPVLFGVKVATSFALQVNQVETLSPFPLTFGSAKRGLFLYGAATFHKTATGVAYVKV